MDDAYIYARAKAMAKDLVLLLALVAAAGLPAAKGDIYDYRGYCAGSKFTELDRQRVDRKLATALINRRVHRSSVSQSEKRMVTAPPPLAAAPPHVASCH